MSAIVCKEKLKGLVGIFEPRLTALVEGLRVQNLRKQRREFTSSADRLPGRPETVTRINLVVPELHT